MCRSWSKSAHKCIPYNNRCMCAKFYPDRLRFGSTMAKNLFLSKTARQLLLILLSLKHEMQNTKGY